MAFTPLSALLGGALIGLSASALLVVEGRVAGVSGIIGGIVQPRRREVAWRVAFVTGLLLGGLLVDWRDPQAIAPRSSGGPAGLVAAAGLLVGFGTRLSGGCTSGHGVCGISRFSRRSIAAVLTFMATGALAAFFTRHVFSRLG